MSHKERQDILSVHAAVIGCIGYIGFKVANLNPHNLTIIIIVGISTICAMVASSKLVNAKIPDSFE